MPLEPPSGTNADASPASAIYRPSPILATYRIINNPEILIVDDPIVRFLTLPGVITYVIIASTDLIGLIPTLFDLHPTVNLVIMHVGSNDIMARNSSKLHADLESLYYTVESLGKHCILSGPIPAPSKSSECFSQPLSLHHWLKNDNFINIFIDFNSV